MLSGTRGTDCPIAGANDPATQTQNRGDDDGHDEEAARQEADHQEGPAAKAKPKPAPAAPAKKRSQIAAALKVLKTATEPMNCKQMVEAMAERKLWNSPGGKTLEATLYASLLRELAK